MHMYDIYVCVYISIIYIYAYIWYVSVYINTIKFNLWLGTGRDKQ